MIPHRRQYAVPSTYCEPTDIKTIFSSLEGVFTTK
jgi:hypothetical protein